MAASATPRPRDLRPSPSTVELLNASEDRRYISIAEAVTITGLHEQTIYNWIRKGKIPAFGRMNAYRVRVVDLMPPVQTSAERQSFQTGRNGRPLPSPAHGSTSDGL